MAFYSANIDWKSCDIFSLIRAAGMQRRKSDEASSYSSVKADRLLALLLSPQCCSIQSCTNEIVHHF